MIKILFLTVYSLAYSIAYSVAYSFPSKCFVIPKPPEVLESILMPGISTVTPTSTNLILEIPSTVTPTNLILEIPSTVTPTVTPTPTNIILEILSTVTPTPTNIILEIPSTVTPTPTNLILEIPSTVTVTPTSTNLILEIPSTVTPVSVDKKQLILDMHNNERELKNVTNLLIWSDSLELSANNLSSSLANRGCPLQHSLGKGVFAQNLYGGYGTINPNFKNANNAWILEKNLIDKPNVSFSEIGHYLIMVSSKYNNVGCSAAINFDSRCYVVTCDYS